ncbi:hypothetical protein [Nocardia arizonensis]|uniref:hypothetical protein n=1 Tax=Nocardia arizonensis TaxID=1141647 RepID=UPI0012E28AE3|nr:hypothetical protein [Nocardia arizonensis]
MGSPIHSDQVELAGELHDLRLRTIDEIFRTQGEPKDFKILFRVIGGLYKGSDQRDTTMIEAIKLGLQEAIKFLPNTRLTDISRESKVTWRDAASILYGLYPFSLEARIEITGYEGHGQNHAKWAKYLRDLCGLPDGSRQFTNRVTDIRQMLADILLGAEMSGGFEQLRRTIQDPVIGQARQDENSTESLVDVDISSDRTNPPVELESAFGDPYSGNMDDSTDMDDHEEKQPTNKFEGDVTQYVTGIFSQTSGSIGGNVIHHHYSTPQQFKPPQPPESTEPNG